MHCCFCCPPEWLEIAELLLHVAALIGGVVGFWYGLHHYKDGQTWKRSEFLISEMKEFLSNPKVVTTLKMLDYTNNIKVPLFPEDPTYANRFVEITPKLLISALRTHVFGERFTEDEIAIRDHMDVLLGYFTRFESWIDTGLYDVEALKPYLEYYIKAISTTVREDGGPHRLNEQIHRYIKHYGDRGAMELFERFGHKLNPTDEPEKPKA